MTNLNQRLKAGAAYVALAVTLATSLPAAASPTVVAARPATSATRIAAHRPRPPGITDREAVRLRQQHQQYQQMKRLANADGDISRSEQARLDHKAQQLRRSIHIAGSN
jgi:hypothetical protein